ncbi:MAG: alpha/beta fold hydrolase [Candidatus Sericytochromatia bacterium]|nr:alpha/beta fold hydrolase [Candidatus Tanganyikabacteria bacterium]
MIGRIVADASPKALAGGIRRRAGRQLSRRAGGPGSDSLVVRQGIMRLLGRVEADKALQGAADSAGLRLRKNYGAFFLPFRGGKAKGTVVMFHGYTAGPWQYGEMAARFNKAGYHVYAPRLPGHGFMNDATGRATGERVLKMGQERVYEQFVKDVYADASSLGAPVFALGLSGGGNAALKMAELTPVKRVVAMAPFLGSNFPMRLVASTLDLLDRLTFGLFGRLLNRIPKGRNKLASLDIAHPHTQGSIGQVLAMRRVGTSVRKLEAPVQFITTAGDVLSATGPVGRLFKRSGGAGSGNGWFHFGADAKVPHAMVSRSQNKAPGAVDKIEQIALDFISRGKATLAR